MKLLKIAVLSLAMLVVGCALQYAVPKRVNVYSLGEVKVDYYAQVDVWSAPERQQFEATLKKEINARLSPKMNGNQPLHVYITLEEATFAHAGGQLALSLLFGDFHDTVTGTAAYISGESGVAAAENVETALRRFAGTESKEAVRYDQFLADAGDGLLSKRNTRINNLAKELAKSVTNSVTHGFK